MVMIRIQKRMLSFFVIFILLLSAMIGIAGATEDNINPENTENEVKPGAIVGKVLNEESAPLEGVLVILVHGVEQSNPDKVRKLEAKTNERGYFEFNELPRGVYIIEVHGRGYKSWRDEVKVPADETVELKIILEKAKEEPEKEFSIVSGWVYIAEEGEPIAGAHVMFMNEHNDERPIETRTDREGHFKVRLLRGLYVIYVEAEDFEAYREELKVPGNNEIELKILLWPFEDEDDWEERPSLCGRIFDAKTDEPIFGWVELTKGHPCKNVPEKPKHEKECYWHEPEKPEDDIFWRTYSDGEGFYEFFNLPPGHYEMRVFAKGHKMYYNELNIEDEPIYLDIYLLREKPEPKPMAVIYGRVVNARTNEPIAGAIVCALPPEIFHKLKEEVNTELNELGLSTDDLDIENMEFDTEVEIDIEVETGEVVYLDIDKDNLKPEEKTRCNKDCDKENFDDDNEKSDPKNRKLISYLRKFCTKTDERGIFKLIIPAGVYIGIVKARGYQLFAQKFEVEPGQEIKVSVPLKPMINENLKANENDSANNDDTEKSSTETGSDPAEVGSSVAAAAGKSSTVLSATLGILVLIALGLLALIWRKHGIFKRKKK